MFSSISVGFFAIITLRLCILSSRDAIVIAIISKLFFLRSPSGIVFLAILSFFAFDKSLPNAIKLRFNSSSFKGSSRIAFSIAAISSVIFLLSFLHAAISIEMVASCSLILTLVLSNLSRNLSLKSPNTSVNCSNTSLCSGVNGTFDVP